MQTAKSKIKNIGSTFFILVFAWAMVMLTAHSAAAGYAESAHGDSIDGADRSNAQCIEWPDGSCTTGSCAHCHDTFDPTICGVNEHMVFFYPLDGSGGDDDMCMQCHTDTGSLQVGGMLGAPGDIETVFGKTYKHNVLGYSGLHKFWPWSPPADAGDVEDRAYLSANKHVECNDCHNPHAAEPGLHSSNQAHVSAGTNLISASGALKGAFGVEPVWNTTWRWYYGSWLAGGADSWPTEPSNAVKEYQICLKCHADYNTNVASWGGSGSQAWTNVALEFNPVKQSYHPVVQGLPEIDPGYSYDPELGESDYHGSNQLPPAFTSLVIGDSGLKTGGSTTYYTDSSKNWDTGQWQNWGVRFGTWNNMYDHTSMDAIRNITSNTSNTLTLDTGYLTHENNKTVYSIEYYAGRNATKSDNTVTHAIKNFNLYVPSLVGYKVVIQEDLSSIFSGAVDWVAVGTVISNMATSFTVDAWTALKGTVPASGTVAYYFSSAGQTMMCSDCHSNDEISTTAAQGPHGSAVKWMLKGRNRAWPLASAASNGAGDDGTNPYAVYYSAGGTQALRYENDGTADGLFCLNCHSTVTFSKGADGLQNVGNVHLLHNSPCVNCHIMVPHGSKYSRLIGDQDNDGYGNYMPTRYAFDNDLTNMGVTDFVIKRFDPDHSGRAGGPVYPTGSHSSNAYCYYNCHW